VNTQTREGAGRLSRKLTRIALLAGIYAAITLALYPLSYGAIQVRVSEALTVLPFLTPLAVPGLFVGCLIANILGGLGLNDVIFGSLATLVAAYLTRRMPSPILAPLPPIIINALVIPIYLSSVVRVPYLPLALSIAAGQAVACYALGYPLLLFLRRQRSFDEFFR
jgi:uncharacterized membrane protein